MKKSWIVLINFSITLALLAFVIFQGQAAFDERVQNFASMTVAMERVTENYLEGEQNICDVWARHIVASRMTLEEAQQFVRSSHVLPDASAHLIYSGRLTLQPLTFSLVETAENLVNLSQPMVKEKTIDFSFRCGRIETEYLHADQPDLHQHPLQRHQVPRARRLRVRGAALGGERKARLRASHLQRGRHGHRHEQGIHGADVPALLPPDRQPREPDRGHGAGPRHHQRDGHAHGRQHRLRERAGQGHHLHGHAGPPEGRPQAGGDAARRHRRAAGGRRRRHAGDRALEDTRIASIPIIAMTADAFSENVAECLDAGMNGHIAKPIDIKLVLREIGRIREEKEQRGCQSM